MRGMPRRIRTDSCASRSSSAPAEPYPIAPCIDNDRIVHAQRRDRSPAGGRLPQNGQSVSSSSWRSAADR